MNILGTAALAAFTFALGFCMARVSLCSVATVRLAVMNRHGSGLGGLLVAAATASLGLLLLHWHWPNSIATPAGPALAGPLLIGGVLLGAGALVNGGCYLSSVTYVGAGNLHYLFTLLGFTLLSAWLHWHVPSVGMEQHQFLPWAAGLALSVIVVGITLVWLQGRRQLRWPALRASWPWPLAALLCGLCAAAVNGLQPGWSYAKLLEAVAAGRVPSPAIALSAGAIFAGAITSSLLMHRFHLTPWSWLRAVRCLAGGLLMGYAASLIPGGNDTLLLWAVPSLAAYALIAYGLMLVTIAVAFALQRLFQGARRT